jgi:hypothetical protein
MNIPVLLGCAASLSLLPLQPDIDKVSRPIKKTTQNIFVS